MGKCNECNWKEHLIKEDPMKSDYIKKEEFAPSIELEKVKWKKRRLIYNDDGCAFMTKDCTPESFLYADSGRMCAVPGTQVDSVFICSGATTVLTHPSSVAENYADTLEKYAEDPDLGILPGGKHYEMWSQVAPSLRELFRAGTDPVQLTIDFCRKHNLEVFYTYRVNDTHAVYDWCGCERSTWMREHPGYMMSTKEEGDKHKETDPKRIWSALDFEIPAVRSYLLSILEDVAERYDVDGIEIDYFRSPLFFRPNLEFKPVTEAQKAILTEFQADVRRIVEKAGRKRGRVMLLAARTPMTVNLSNHAGIDIIQWLKDKLLDILTTGGGYVPFTMPNRELIKLGHEYGVPVYPTISQSGMNNYGGERNGAIEAWRGVASNIWNAGADGIVLFNHFPNKPSPQFMELGEQEELKRMNKIFAIDNYYKKTIWGGHSQAIPSDYVLPAEISCDGSETEVKLPVGDDIAAASKAGMLETVFMKLKIGGLAEKEDLDFIAISDSIRVKLNGKVLSPVEKDTENRLMIFYPCPSCFVQGDNKVSVFIDNEGGCRKGIPDSCTGTDSACVENTLELTSVEVHVKYL